jgi:hypothetical protein
MTERACDLNPSFVVIVVIAVTHKGAPTDSPGSLGILNGIDALRRVVSVQANVLGSQIAGPETDRFLAQGECQDDTDFAGGHGL